MFYPVHVCVCVCALVLFHPVTVLLWETRFPWCENGLTHRDCHHPEHQPIVYLPCGGRTVTLWAPDKIIAQPNRREILKTYVTENDFFSPFLFLSSTLRCTHTPICLSCSALVLFWDDLLFCVPAFHPTSHVCFVTRSLSS